VSLLRFDIQLTFLWIFDPAHTNSFNSIQGISHIFSPFPFSELLFFILGQTPSSLSPSPSPRGSARRPARTRGRRDGVHGWQHNGTPLLCCCCSNCCAVTPPPRLGVLVQRQPLVSRRRWRCRTWGDHHDWGRRELLPHEPSAHYHVEMIIFSIMNLVATNWLWFLRRPCVHILYSGLDNAWLAFCLFISNNKKVKFQPFFWCIHMFGPSPSNYLHSKL
jgi:hypothetical protein